MQWLVNFVEVCEENSDRYFPPSKGNCYLKQLIYTKKESTFVVLVDVWLLIRWIISILDKTKTNKEKNLLSFALSFVRRNHLLWWKNQMKGTSHWNFFGKMAYVKRYSSFLVFTGMPEYHCTILLIRTITMLHDELRGCSGGKWNGTVLSTGTFSNGTHPSRIYHCVRWNIVLFHLPEKISTVSHENLKRSCILSI